MARVMSAVFRRWAQSENGATAVEYGFIVAGVALAIGVAVFALGDRIIGVFDEITSYLQP